MSTDNTATPADLNRVVANALRLLENYGELAKKITNDTHYESFIDLLVRIRVTIDHIAEREFNSNSITAVENACLLLELALVHMFDQPGLFTPRFVLPAEN